MKSKALLLLVVMTQLTCHQVIFHAPPGTTMTCQENPHVIAAFNGVSTISCLLLEEVGTPVADGTVVQFFTDLGRIPEQGRTNDGVVRVNLQSDGRSGTATVLASSGSGATGGGSSSSTSSTSSTINVERGLSASAAGSSRVSSALMADDSVTVIIGTASVSSLRLSAFPPRLTDSRTSQITATVFDGNGNPVAGVPVFFEVETATTTPLPTPTGTPTPTPSTTPVPPTGNNPVFEHMDSQGQPIFTDSNGQARDVLRTRYPREAPPRTVVVRATVPFGNVNDTVQVFIN